MIDPPRPDIRRLRNRIAIVPYKREPKPSALFPVVSRAISLPFALPAPLGVALPLPLTLRDAKTRVTSSAARRATRLARCHGYAMRARLSPSPPHSLLPLFPLPPQSALRRARVMFVYCVVFTISIFRLISAMLELRVLNIISRIPSPAPPSSCSTDTLPFVSYEEKEEAHLRALRCNLWRPSCRVISIAGKQMVKFSLVFDLRDPLS